LSTLWALARPGVTDIRHVPAELRFYHDTVATTDAIYRDAAESALPPPVKASADFFTWVAAHNV
jgi:hypothetical protein